MALTAQEPADWQQGIKPWILEKIEASPSLRKMAIRIIARGGSRYTASNYAKDVWYYCQWLKLSPEKAIGTRYDWPAIMNEYLDYLTVERKLAPSGGPKAYAAVKKWLAVNEVLSANDLSWDKVELNTVINVETEELPKKESLRKIIGSGDLAEKALALVAISSGLRIGSILQLQLKDVDLEREIPLISPKQETTKRKRRFHTFMSPEAKETLLQYLKDREARGKYLEEARKRGEKWVRGEEKLTPESWLIAAERPLGARITQINSGDRRWMNMVKRAGFDRKGRTWHTLHFHTLRKFFQTWSNVSGVPGILVEYFMGHRANISQVYFIPEGVERPPEEIIKKLEAEYRKALPALTVMSDSDEIRKLETKLEESREEYEKKLRALEEKEDARAKAEKLLVDLTKQLETQQQQIRDMGLKLAEIGASKQQKEPETPIPQAEKS